MENLQLSLAGYSISKAVKSLMAEPGTGTTQWPVKEAEPAELPGHEALAEALWCFSQQSHIGGNSPGTGVSAADAG